MLTYESRKDMTARTPADITRMAQPQGEIRNLAHNLTTPSHFSAHAFKARTANAVPVLVM